MATLGVLYLDVVAVAANVAASRHALRAYLETVALDAERIDDVVLATGEAVANAVEHAYRHAVGTVSLHACVREATVVIEVCDRGSWRTDGGDPDRGRGLSIMKALVDQFSIARTNRGTSVRFEIAL